MSSDSELLGIRIENNKKIIYFIQSFYIDKYDRNDKIEMQNSCVM